MSSEAIILLTLLGLGSIGLTAYFNCQLRKTTLAVKKNCDSIGVMNDKIETVIALLETETTNALSGLSATESEQLRHAHKTQGFR